MRDLLTMNKKERERKSIFDRYKAKGIKTLQIAAELMHLSYRQCKRLWKRYQALGDAGLVHSNRGKPGRHCLPKSLKQACLSAYKNNYDGYGPTFASEKLAEREHLVVNPETLRLWLKGSGYWHSRQRKPAYHPHRSRRQCFGELVQIDGSIHQWFGEGNGYSCLIRYIDDATGIRQGYLASGETIEGVFSAMRLWLKHYGIPQAFYVDLRTTYISPKPKKTVKKGIETLVQSQFERACAELGIEVIKAYSPQAKGRVERCHQVDQDRLVKEIQLNGFKKLDEVNQYMQKHYNEQLNQKFSVPAVNSVDKHRPCPSKRELDKILCINRERLLRHNYTIRYNGQYYQLTARCRTWVRPGKQILVRENFNGQISLWYGDKKLTHERIKEPSGIKLVQTKQSHPDRRLIGRQNKRNSPWNQFNPDWLKSSKTRSNSLND